MPHPLILTQPLEQRVKQGHPWLFSDALRFENTDAVVRPGDIVDVISPSGNFIARGVCEPDSPILVRIWTTNPAINVDNQLLEARIRRAAKRRPFPTPDTNAFRLLHGENDLIPGVTCDIYDKCAVFRIDGLAAERWLKPAVRIVKRLFPIDVVAVRRSDRYRGDLPKATWFTKPSDSQASFLFQEHGLTYKVDPIKGQKTGFFLDQRANRQLVAKRSKGKRLLNLFSYTGGFSLAAAAQGATQTTSVDLSGPAIEDARTHFKINGISPDAHQFVAADVFDFLDDLPDRSAPYEIAICDPPSFAHRRNDIPKATEAYQHLFSTLLRKMPEGSRVALASCSSQISRSSFEQIVLAASLEADVQLLVEGIWGADIDHPSLLPFPEGNYLQFLMATIEPT